MQEVFMTCLLYFFLQIIEKRRRDRINNCLVELRRLVPAAFEKQVCLLLTHVVKLVLQLTGSAIAHGTFCLLACIFDQM